MTFDQLVSSVQILQHDLRVMKDKVHKIETVINKQLLIPHLCNAKATINTLKCDGTYDLLQNYVIVNELGDDLVEIIWSGDRGFQLQKCYITMSDVIFVHLAKTKFYKSSETVDLNEVEKNTTEESRIYHKKYLKFMDKSSLVKDE